MIDRAGGVAPLPFSYNKIGEILRKYGEDVL